MHKIKLVLFSLGGFIEKTPNQNPEIFDMRVFAKALVFWIEMISSYFNALLRCITPEMRRKLKKEVADRAQFKASILSGDSSDSDEESGSKEEAEATAGILL